MMIMSAELGSKQSHELGQALTPHKVLFKSKNNKNTLNVLGQLLGMYSGRVV